MGRTSRAVIFSGNGTWELRELPVPDPPPGGAVLRVEAVGMCHSDIDHMHGIVHTPWGGAYPSIPGHEIVGRIDALAPGTGARWGVTEGQRVAVRESVPLAGGIRVYGHDYGIDERSGLFGGCADYMELLPEPWSSRSPTTSRPTSSRSGSRSPSPSAGRPRSSQGNSVAILGPGHLGLASIVAARAAGASGSSSPARPPTPSGSTRPAGLASRKPSTSRADPVERIRELTGDGVDVVIDAASGSTSTVTQGMQMARRGGTVVIGGLKDRKPVDGFISDWIPMRRIHIHPGAGIDIARSVELIVTGLVPTAELVGETLPIQSVGEALQLLDRAIPGRDAVRVALRHRTWEPRPLITMDLAGDSSLGWCRTGSRRRVRA